MFLKTQKQHLEVIAKPTIKKHNTLKKFIVDEKIE